MEARIDTKMDKELDNQMAEFKDLIAKTFSSFSMPVYGWFGSPVQLLAWSLELLSTCLLSSPVWLVYVQDYRQMHSWLDRALLTRQFITQGICL